MFAGAATHACVYACCACHDGCAPIHVEVTEAPPTPQPLPHGNFALCNSWNATQQVEQHNMSVCGTTRQSLACGNYAGPSYEHYGVSMTHSASQGGLSHLLQLHLRPPCCIVARCCWSHNHGICASLFPVLTRHCTSLWLQPECILVPGHL